MRKNTRLSPTPTDLNVWMSIIEEIMFDAAACLHNARAIWNDSHRNPTGFSSQPFSRHLVNVYLFATITQLTKLFANSKSQYVTFEKLFNHLVGGKFNDQVYQHINGSVALHKHLRVQQYPTWGSIHEMQTDIRVLLQNVVQLCAHDIVQRLKLWRDNRTAHSNYGQLDDPSPSMAEMDALLREADVFYSRIRIGLGKGDLLFDSASPEIEPVIRAWDDAQKYRKLLLEADRED